MITLDEFKKAELRVATVLSAERIEGSEKLLKLQVDLGVEQRQILSGIAKYYEPESLVGRQIIIIANLEPRMMMGLESNGMVLASGDEHPILLQPSEKTENGSLVR